MDAETVTRPLLPAIGAEELGDLIDAFDPEVPDDESMGDNDALDVHESSSNMRKDAGHGYWGGLEAHNETDSEGGHAKFSEAFQQWSENARRSRRTRASMMAVEVPLAKTWWLFRAS